MSPRTRPKTKAHLFEVLAEPDEDGFSRRVEIDELELHGLGFGNGGSWCRKDGTLGKIYNIKTYKEKGRIIAVELHGYQQLPSRRSVRADIKREITKQRCAILGTGNPECDHKDGRIYDKPASAPDNQLLEDFQPLSKAANNAKRQHCKRCKETGKRYDATQLGYAVSQFKGDDVYRGTCVGCYWHDPLKFNAAVSSRKNGTRREEEP